VKNEEQIRAVANEVRAWAEHLQKQTMNLFSDRLMGLCAISSAYLFCKLSELGINTTIVSNPRHCYVLTEDDYVVDVTATQFGFHEKVLISPREEVICLSNCYEQEVVHTNVDSLRLWQIHKGWPAHQMVASPIDNTTTSCYDEDEEKTQEVE